MKIAVVTTSFLPHIGGAEFAIHYLAQNWSRLGHEVIVINAVTSRARSDAAYAVRCYPLLRGAYRFGAHRRLFAWYHARQLRDLLDEIKPDRISAHFGYPTALWLSKLDPMPRFLITCHGPALNETPSGPRQRYRLDRALADALNRSVRAVAISHHARRIMEGMGVEAGRIVDIPNGVDLERFAPRPQTIDLRARFDLSSEALIVLSVGRESWAKSYDDGIEAFRLVSAKLPSARYIIVGRGTSRWSSLISRLGLEGRVLFCEGLFDRDLVAAYQQSDLFFLPSSKELCPLVVPEAMAAGLPSVVTNISGSQDMIRPGCNGIVVEPGDRMAMAEALTQLLVDRDLRRAMGERSLEEAKRYSWTRISNEYLAHM